MIERTVASGPQRQAFLNLMWEESGEVLERGLGFLGLTPEAFERLVHTQGNVFVLSQAQVEVGYVWLEQRERVLHIHAIVIRRPFQRRGIGTAVLSELENEYRGSVDAIELGVERGNQAARALYEKLGYEVVRHIDEVCFDVLQKHI